MFLWAREGGRMRIFSIGDSGGILGRFEAIDTPFTLSMKSNFTVMPAFLMQESSLSWGSNPHNRRKTRGNVSRKRTIYPTGQHASPIILI